MRKWIEKLIKAIKAWANRLAADYKAWKKRCRESRQQRAEKRKQYANKVKTQWKNWVQKRKMKWKIWGEGRREWFKKIRSRDFRYGPVRHYRVETERGNFELTARSYEFKLIKGDARNILELKDGRRKVATFTNVAAVMQL